LENVLPQKLTGQFPFDYFGSYNADATFTTDSTTGIKNCINDARSQGKTVWIPPGKFMVNNLASGGLNIAESPSKAPECGIPRFTKMFLLRLVALGLAIFKWALIPFARCVY